MLWYAREWKLLLKEQRSWSLRIEIRIVTSLRPMSGVSSLDAIVLERRALYRAAARYHHPHTKQPISHDPRLRA